MTNKFSTILLILLSLFSFELKSQEKCLIYGKIIDSKNNEISGANIISNISNKGVVSNEKGEYKINLEIGKKTILFISHVQFSNTKKVVMMLANKNIKVALASTHIPLKEVPNFINISILFLNLL